MFRATPMRVTRIGSAMKAYGFTPQELDEGWALLQATGTVRLNRDGNKIVDSEKLRDLDA